MTDRIAFDSTDTNEAGTVTWVAVGPAGAVGSVHRSEDGYTVDVFGKHAPDIAFRTLEAAKRAIHAALGPQAERPEFRAH